MGTWALINHIKRSHPTSSPFSQPTITYWVNLLQNMSVNAGEDIFITLNPSIPPHPPLLHGIWEHTRPIVDREALICREELPIIQDVRGISYCGSWTGFGTHEDSIRSGFEVAVRHLGAELPFELVNSEETRRRVPPITMSEKMFRKILKLAPYVITAERFMVAFIYLLWFFCPLRLLILIWTTERKRDE